MPPTGRLVGTNLQGSLVSAMLHLFVDVEERDARQLGPGRGRACAIAFRNFAFGADCGEVDVAGLVVGAVAVVHRVSGAARAPRPAQKSATQ